MWAAFTVLSPLERYGGGGEEGGREGGREGGKEGRRERGSSGGGGRRRRGPELLPSNFLRWRGPKPTHNCDTTLQSVLALFL